MWTFDPKRKLYVNSATGETLTIDEMSDLMDSIIEETNNDTIIPLVLLLTSNEIDTPTWRETFGNVIKDTFTILALIALGGLLSSGILDRLEERIRVQYVYLEQFANDILSGVLTPAEILRRSRMYINSTRQIYWTILDEEFGKADYTKERWETQGDANVCGPCDEAGMMGWQPIGTFGEPGSGIVFRSPTTMCLGLTLCRCRKDYS